MAVSRQTMTDEQRKSVALEYLKAFDSKGVTSSGGSILDLFADDAQVFFPKWGLANGKTEIGKLFNDFGGLTPRDQARLRRLQLHHDGQRCLRVRGHELRCASRRPVARRRHARRPMVRRLQSVRDFLIQRCFIYLDPDYAGRDTARYPWLSEGGRDPSKPMG